MSIPRILGSALAALPLLTLQSAPRSGAGFTALVYVEGRTRVTTEFTALAPGGAMRDSRRDTVVTTVVRQVTPAVLEIYGSHREVRIQSTPEQPLRIRVVMAANRSLPVARYDGWSFRLRPSAGTYVPSEQDLPAPNRH